MMKNLCRLTYNITHIQNRLLMVASQRWSLPFCPNCSRNVSTTLSPQEEGVVVNPLLSKVKASKKTKKKKKVVITPSSPAKKAVGTSLSASAKLTLNYAEKHSGVKNRELTSLLSKQSLRSTSAVPTTVYLVDEKEAKNIGKIVKLENLDKSSPVLELHAGLGLLTSELVNEMGFKYVTCFENNPDLSRNLTSRYNVPVIDCAVDQLPRLHHLDKQDGGERINSILTSIVTEKGCGEESGGAINQSKRQLLIVGAIPHVSIINFLIRSLVTKRIFFEDDLPWSGVTLLVALGPKAAHICTATPESGMVAYRPTSVFFQTLFTVKDLGTASRQAFIPWEIDEGSSVRKEPKIKRRLKVDDPTVVRLMRVELNRQVQDKIGKDNLFAYWYFVRQHLYARSNRIIPELERWIPGCGVRLIKQGFTIFSQFGTLSPDEILKLYLQFVSWPEFASSSFLSALEKFQTRLELSEEDEENK